MKSLLSCLILAIGVCLSLPNAAFAQASAPASSANSDSTTASLPTVDQIIDRATLASGGKPAWSKITSMYLKGSVEIPANHANGTFEVYSMAPNKDYQSITLGGAVVAKQGFDGSNAWKTAPGHGIVDVQGDELEGTKLDSEFYSEINLKQLYPQMVLQESTTIAGRPAYAVLATPLHGKARKRYFDKETGLHVGMSSETTEDGKAVQVETYFEDFRTVEGIQVPYTTHVVTPDFTMVLHLQNVRTNLPILNWTFQKPAANTYSAGPVSVGHPSTAAPLSSGGVSGNTYSNALFGFTYTYPAGWAAQGEATSKEIMRVGRGIATGNDPARNAAFDAAMERTYQLLTVFQYPVGTPGKSNSSIQVVAERVDFAPGIKDGRDYLLNVQSQMNSARLSPEFAGNIGEFAIGGKQFFRLDDQLRSPAGVVHQMYVSTKLDKYVLSFIFTSLNQEDLNMLYNTLGSLKFDPASH